jgi:hypothetical protein
MLISLNYSCSFLLPLYGMKHLKQKRTKKDQGRKMLPAPAQRTPAFRPAQRAHASNE